MADKGKGILVVGGLGLAVLGTYLLTRKAKAPPGLEGRIGTWGYWTACAYPEVHVEKGNWPDHVLDFDYDLGPSTWYIDLVCWNDSPSMVIAEVEIIDSNATIIHEPRPSPPDGDIEAGGHKKFSFCMGLPRVPGEYYFDVVLFFDGVVVDEGMWVINYS